MIIVYPLVMLFKVLEAYLSHFSLVLLCILYVDSSTNNCDFCPHDNISKVQKYCKNYVEPSSKDQNVPNIFPYLKWHIWDMNILLPIGRQKLNFHLQVFTGLFCVPTKGFDDIAIFINLQN